MAWSETIYLKLPSQAVYEEHTIDGECDVIGTIVGEDGVPLDGFHVNIRLKDDAALPVGWQAYVITPTHPRRIFADG